MMKEYRMNKLLLAGSFTEVHSKSKRVLEKYRILNDCIGNGESRKDFDLETLKPTSVRYMVVMLCIEILLWQMLLQQLIWV